MEQQLTLAILKTLDVFGIEPIDTICQLTTDFVKVIIENI